MEGVRADDVRVGGGGGVRADEQRAKGCEGG